MPERAVHIMTKLVDEDFYVRCPALYDSEAQAQIATITSIDEIRIEKREATDPETFSEAVAEAGFSSLQLLDDTDPTLTDAIVAGITDADPDATPAPGHGYFLVVVCTITFTAAYLSDEEVAAGLTTATKVFRRPWKIPASLYTAPAS